MDELHKLERVQIMLSFVETRGLSTNDRESDRFIANFLLFMTVRLFLASGQACLKNNLPISTKVQPCGALDMQKKCHLIYEHLNKISMLSLDASLQSVFEEGLGADQNAGILGIYPECSAQQEIERIPHSWMLKTIHSVDEAVISIGSMQRANSTMEDFCRSYFMFHGLDISKAHSIFSFLPVLYFTESYIYQLDTLNERKLLPSTDVSAEKGFRRCSASDPFDPLIDLLQQQGLMTERIRTELHLGVEYWKLERLLCDELTKKDMILIEDVMRAIQLKSFDYRVLNLLLYQLRGQPVNELHMEFLSASEFLVEVSDDLYDYEEDVIDNTFNILRMFVGIYGASKAPAMLAKCITKAEEKYDRLARELDPELSFNCWRRYEEATGEGCAASGHVVGKWTIPSIIVDEESFRSQAVFSK